MLKANVRKRSWQGLSLTVVVTIGVSALAQKQVGADDAAASREADTTAAILEEVFSRERRQAVRDGAYPDLELEGLRSDDPRPQQTAIRGFTDGLDVRVFGDLIRMLEEESGDIRKRVGRVLREMSGELIPDDPERWRQYVLEIENPTEPADVLIARVDDPRLEVSRRALFQLTTLRDPLALDFFVERFMNRKGGRPDGEKVIGNIHGARKQASVCRNALRAIGGPEVVERLAPFIKEDDARDLLMEQGDAIVPPLLKLLDDPDVFIRNEAAEMLVLFGPPDTGALSQYGVAAAERMRKALDAPGLSDRARVVVGVILAHVGDRSQWPLLVKVIASGSSEDMKQAISHMGRTKNRIFLPLIEKALAREDATQHVAYAAAYCGGVEALPLLRKARVHPNKVMHWTANKFIRELTKDKRK